MSNFRKYLANREWRKRITFNNNWYELQSIFDNSDENKIDFNSLVKAPTNKQSNKGKNIFENLQFEIDNDEQISMNKTGFSGISDKINQNNNYIFAKHVDIQQIYKMIFNENKPEGYKYVEKGPLEGYPCYMFQGSPDSSYIKSLVKKCKEKKWTNFAIDLINKTDKNYVWEYLGFILKYAIYDKKQDFDTFLLDIKKKFKKFIPNYNEVYDHAKDDKYFNEFVENIFKPFNKNNNNKYYIQSYLISEDKGLMLLTYQNDYLRKDAATSILFTTGLVNYSEVDEYNTEIKIAKNTDPVLDALKKESIRKFDNSLFQYKELSDAYVYECKFTYVKYGKFTIPHTIFNVFKVFKAKSKNFYVNNNYPKYLYPDDIEIHEEDKIHNFVSSDSKVLFTMIYSDEIVNKETAEYQELCNENKAIQDNGWEKEKYGYAYIIAYK